MIRIGLMLIELAVYSCLMAIALSIWIGLVVP